MTTYNIRKLLEIADNYDEYDIDVSRSNTLWGSSHWSDMIDAKIDFQRAFAKLSPLEQALVKDPNTSNPRGRSIVLYKLLDYLNGR